MKSKYIYKMAIRNITRNKRRTILSAVAISLAVLFVCFMQSFTGGLWTSVRTNIYNYETGHIKIMNERYVKEEKLMPLDLSISGYEKDYNDVIDKIQDIKEIKYIIPRTKFGAILNTPDGEMKTMMGIALLPEKEKPVNDIEDKIIDGRIFEPFSPAKHEIVVGKGLAHDLGCSVGSKITLMTKTAEDGLGHMTFEVSGIFQYGVAHIDKKFFFTHLTTASKFLKMEGEVIEFVIFLDDVDKSKKVAKEINDRLNKIDNNPYKAYPWELQKDGQYAEIFKITKIYDFIYIVFLVLASLVIINTTMMVIYERMKEIGTIAALGLRGYLIVRLFFYEAVIISFFGSLGGIIPGAIGTYFFSKVGINLASLTGGSMNEMGMSEIIYPTFSITNLIIAFLFGIFVASICSYIPARRAARIEPVEAMRRI